MPRFAFTDLPLGNPVGPSGDPGQQRRILRAALEFAEAAPLARSSVVLPVEWNGPDNWRDTYMSIDDPEALRAVGEARRARQARDKNSQRSS